MAVKSYASQLEYVGKGYLDAKMQPVNTVEDLSRIPRSERFIGLTVTVLDDGSGEPHDYWIQQTLSNWVLKVSPGYLDVTGDDLDE